VLPTKLGKINNDPSVLGPANADRSPTLRPENWRLLTISRHDLRAALQPAKAAHPSHEPNVDPELMVV
jgi:hypothetical protein